MPFLNLILKTLRKLMTLMCTKTKYVRNYKKIRQEIKYETEDYLKVNMIEMKSSNFYLCESSLAIEGVYLIWNSEKLSPRNECKK